MGLAPIALSSEGRGTCVGVEVGCRSPAYMSESVYTMPYRSSMCRMPYRT